MPKIKPLSYEPKPLFVERMKLLLGDDFEDYMKILKEPPVKSFRCNTLKISPDDLKKRLEKRGWIISQPFSSNKEIMVVDSDLQPGELGRTLEHLLGYYYIQEIASMLPPLALKPSKGDLVLDLCASPGSKTTQMAAMMNNEGTIIANEVNLGRLRILSSNLGRCGVTNVLETKRDGIVLCDKLNKEGLFFDKILLDAPCSGEGTLRSTPRTYKMWNPKTISSLSGLQKGLISSAINLLKVGGELVYSTCTHAPEENEEIVDFVLRKFEGSIEIIEIKLPFPTRKGILKWGEKEYLEEVKYSCRVYPQDNNTEGFFISKFRKIK